MLLFFKSILLRVPFWVQLHGMPFGTLNSQSAINIAKQIGEIEEIENSKVEGVLLRSFMRVRILVNVYRPLPTGCWVPRKDLPKTWVVFRYEKLQGMCFNCGITGHEQKSYKKDRIMSVVNKGVSRYSAQLSMPAARAISALAANMGRWKSKQPPQAAGDSSLRRQKDYTNTAGNVAQHQWEESFFNLDTEESSETEWNKDRASSVCSKEEDWQPEGNLDPQSTGDHVLEEVSLFQAETVGQGGVQGHGGAQSGETMKLGGEAKNPFQGETSTSGSYI